MNSPVRRSYKRIYIGLIFVAAIIAVRVLIDYRFPDYRTTSDTFLRSGECEIAEINDDFTLIIRQTQSESKSSRTILIKSRLHGIEFENANKDSFADFSSQISLFEIDAKKRGAKPRIEFYAMQSGFDKNGSG